MEKVQLYFEAALAVPEEKRADLLNQLCGDESKLLHEVDALLKADAQNKMWDSSRLFDIKLEQPKVFQAGDTIGPYSIISPIGKGGMGVIYKALDSRLQRHVALKPV